MKKFLQQRRKILVLKIHKKRRIWKTKREFHLLLFFGFLFGVIITRMIYLQIVQVAEYETLFYNQHEQYSSLKAKRGNIYILDKSGNPMQLTDNISVYTLFIDPVFVKNKQELLPFLTELLFKHFCETYGLTIPTKRQCIEHIEEFSRKKLLPNTMLEAYTGTILTTSGSDLTGLFLMTASQLERQQKLIEETEKIIHETSSGALQRIIHERLDEMIKIGIKTKNYMGFVEKDALIQELMNGSFDYLSLEEGHYLYSTPGKVINKEKESETLEKIFRKHNEFISREKIIALLSPQEIRYVSITKKMNAKRVKILQGWKKEYAQKKTDSIPLFHGVGLEEHQQRYYPYGSFMSHILGFIDTNGQPGHGIEEFMNETLKGKDGIIKGLAVPWIGEIGSNNIDIEKPKNGFDVTLTIDPMIQRELEKKLERYSKELRADSAATIIIDPFSGKIKAMANYPVFDPNTYEDVYKIQPLSINEKHIVEDPTYVDIPVYIFTGDKLKIATTEERFNPTLEKYINRNIIGPQVLIDKNIAMPYEPGSIFKAFTLAIGLDSDELSLYDFYTDEGKVEVGPYTISNVAMECKGTHSFLNALLFSCNVGMVRIAQKIGKFMFYNYLDKLGFGKVTSIELAGEEPGFVENLSTVSLARFFNNAFGQGLLVTPLQIAIGYATLINGGVFIKPTIIEIIEDKEQNTTLNTSRKIQEKIFKRTVSELIKDALVKVMTDGQGKKTNIPTHSIGGKSGTSQISFKGRYQKGVGRTNGSFVGVVTKNNSKYLIVTQVRRPRTNQWGDATAGRIFKEMAQFLIDYERIEN